MKNYRIKPVINEAQEFTWNVEELKTGLVIDSFYFEDDARQYRKFLEGGGAFNGFTPPFVLVIAIDLDQVVNDQFETIFSVEQ
jgi:hypothetical protein